MEKGVTKLVIFNGKDFGYRKNQTRNYLLSQSCAILGDRTASVRDPGDVRQCDPR
jgi:hypothetical protein